MIDHETLFSPTYKDARQKLLDAVAQSEYVHTAYYAAGTGVHGEALAMDVIRVGSTTNQRTLLLTSACHGVEGFAGSAIQLAMLADKGLLSYLNRSGVTLLIVHGLNPYGFSWCRRVTSENVDLNRNAIDFQMATPSNEAYGDLHPYLVSKSWPPSPENELELGRFIEQWGMPRFQEAVSRGQYDYADGLFFGGREQTWNLHTFQTILETWISESTQVAWIDFHTGLGPPGVGEPIFTGGGGDDAFAIAKCWWGEGVTRTNDGSSVSADLNGTLPATVLAVLGERLVTSITLEFGTVEPLKVLAALRLDASAHRVGEGVSSMRELAMKAMRDAFFINTAEWQSAVLSQGTLAVRSAVDGFAVKGARDRAA